LIPNSGHYITCAQNVTDDQWYEYNVTKITQILDFKKYEKFVYLLFYKEKKQ